MLTLTVAFEGLPGAGKTTVIGKITENLTAKGFKVGMVDIETIGDAPILRQISKKYPLGHPSRIILFWMLRLQQYDMMQEMMGDYDIIFADRFWGSTIALDIYGNGVPVEVLHWVGEHIEEYPEITFFFSASIDIVRSRKDAKTMQDDDFAMRVKNGYERTAKEEEWTEINAEQSPDKVTEDCIKVILKKLIT